MRIRLLCEVPTECYRGLTLSNNFLKTPERRLRLGVGLTANAPFCPVMSSLRCNCSSASGSAFSFVHPYNSSSVDRNSGFVKVMRNVISRFASGSKTDGSGSGSISAISDMPSNWKCKEGISDLSRPANIDEPYGFTLDIISSLLAGVTGESLYDIVSPSDDPLEYLPPRNEITSSLRKCCASFADVECGVRSRSFSYVEVRVAKLGKPNATASSNFCGDARYFRNFIRASGSW
jgi:hypothetical protein